MNSSHSLQAVAERLGAKLEDLKETFLNPALGPINPSARIGRSRHSGDTEPTAGFADDESSGRHPDVKPLGFCDDRESALDEYLFRICEVTFRDTSNTAPVSSSTTSSRPRTLEALPRVQSAAACQSDFSTSASSSAAVPSPVPALRRSARKNAPSPARRHQERLPKPKVESLPITSSVPLTTSPLPAKQPVVDLRKLHSPASISKSDEKVAQPSQIIHLQLRVKAPGGQDDVCSKEKLPKGRSSRRLSLRAANKSASHPRPLRAEKDDVSSRKEAIVLRKEGQGTGRLPKRRSLRSTDEDNTRRKRPKTKAEVSELYIPPMPQTAKSEPKVSHNQLSQPTATGSREEKELVTSVKVCMNDGNLHVASPGSALEIQPKTSLEHILDFAHGKDSSLASFQGLSKAVVLKKAETVAVFQGCEEWGSFKLLQYLRTLCTVHLRCLQNVKDHMKDPGTGDFHLDELGSSASEDEWKKELASTGSERLRESNEHASCPPLIRKTIDYIQLTNRLLIKMFGCDDNVARKFIEGCYKSGLSKNISLLSVGIILIWAERKKHLQGDEIKSELVEGCFRLVSDFIVYEVSPMSTICEAKEIRPMTLFVSSVQNGKTGSLPEIINAGFLYTSMLPPGSGKDCRNAFCELVQACILRWRTAWDSTPRRVVRKPWSLIAEQSEDYFLNLLEREEFWSTVVLQALQLARKQEHLSEISFEIAFLGSLVTEKTSMRALLKDQANVRKQMLAMMTRVLGAMSRDPWMFFSEVENDCRSHPGLHSSIQLVQSLLSHAIVQRELVSSDAVVEEQYLSDIEKLIMSVSKLVKTSQSDEDAKAFVKRGPFGRVLSNGSEDISYIDTSDENTSSVRKKSGALSGQDKKDRATAWHRALSFIARVIGSLGKSFEDGSRNIAHMNVLKVFMSRFQGSRNRMRLLKAVMKIQSALERRTSCEGESLELLTSEDRNYFWIVVEGIRRLVACDQGDHTSQSSMEAGEKARLKDGQMAFSVKPVERIVSLPMVTSLPWLRKVVSSERGHQDFDDDHDLLKCFEKVLFEHGKQVLARYEPQSTFTSTWVKLQRKNAYVGDARDLLEKEDKLRAQKCSCIPGYAKEGDSDSRIACSNDLCENRLMKIECIPGECGSGSYCKNQRMQKLEYAQFKMANLKGKGVGILAEEDIKPGALIGEYQGEVISMKEFRERRQEYEGERHFYFMSLTSKLVIDASRKSQATRFLNHSCDPNAETQKWNAEGEPRVGIYAKRIITRGEEITFDYGALSVQEESAPCLCGSVNCRGRLTAKKEHGSEESNLESSDKKRDVSESCDENIISDVRKESAEERLRLITKKIEHAKVEMERAGELGNMALKMSREPADFNENSLDGEARARLSSWQQSICLNIKQAKDRSKLSSGPDSKEDEPDVMRIPRKQSAGSKEERNSVVVNLDGDSENLHQPALLEGVNGGEEIAVDRSARYMNATVEKRMADDKGTAVDKSKADDERTAVGKGTAVEPGKSLDKSAYPTLSRLPKPMQRKGTSEKKTRHSFNGGKSILQTFKETLERRQQTAKESRERASLKAQKKIGRTQSKSELRNSGEKRHSSSYADAIKYAEREDEKNTAALPQGSSAVLKPASRERAGFLPTARKLTKERVKPKTASRRKTRDADSDSDSMGDYSTASEAEAVIDEPLLSPSRLPDGSGAASDDEFVAAPPIEAIAFHERDEVEHEEYVDGRDQERRRHSTRDEQHHIELAAGFSPDPTPMKASDRVRVDRRQLHPSHGDDQSHRRLRPLHETAEWGRREGRFDERRPGPQNELRMASRRQYPQYEPRRRLSNSEKDAALRGPHFAAESGRDMRGDIYFRNRDRDSHSRQQEILRREGPAPRYSSGLDRDRPDSRTLQAREQRPSGTRYRPDSHAPHDRSIDYRVDENEPRRQRNERTWRMSDAFASRNSRVQHPQRRRDVFHGVQESSGNREHRRRERSPEKRRREGAFVISVGDGPSFREARLQKDAHSHFPAQRDRIAQEDRATKPHNASEGLRISGQERDHRVRPNDSKHQFEQCVKSPQSGRQESRPLKDDRQCEAGSSVGRKNGLPAQVRQQGRDETQGDGLLQPGESSRVVTSVQKVNVATDVGKDSERSKDPDKKGGIRADGNTTGSETKDGMRIRTQGNQRELKVPVPETGPGTALTSKICISAGMDSDIASRKRHTELGYSARHGKEEAGNVKGIKQSKPVLEPAKGESPGIGIGKRIDNGLEKIVKNDTGSGHKQFPFQGSNMAENKKGFKPVDGRVDRMRDEFRRNSGGREQDKPNVHRSGKGTVTDGKMKRNFEDGHGHEAGTVMRRLSRDGKKRSLEVKGLEGDLHSKRRRRFPDVIRRPKGRENRDSGATGARDRDASGSHRVMPVKGSATASGDLRSLLRKK